MNRPAGAAYYEKLLVKSPLACRLLGRPEQSRVERASGLRKPALGRHFGIIILFGGPDGFISTLVQFGRKGAQL
jgi:hypothetical protein